MTNIPTEAGAANQVAGTLRVPSADNALSLNWIPACAGMTIAGLDAAELRHCGTRNINEEQGFLIALDALAAEHRDSRFQLHPCNKLIGLGKTQ